MSEGAWNFAGGLQLTITPSGIGADRIAAIRGNFGPGRRSSGINGSMDDREGDVEEEQWRWRVSASYTRISTDEENQPTSLLSTRAVGSVLHGAGGLARVERGEREQRDRNDHKPVGWLRRPASRKESLAADQFPAFSASSPAATRGSTSLGTDPC